MGDFPGMCWPWDGHPGQSQRVNRENTSGFCHGAGSHAKDAEQGSSAQDHGSAPAFASLVPHPSCRTDATRKAAEDFPFPPTLQP
ncbi:MAG: hypothetical protein ACKOPS_00245, partial [Cyanobium sp.]